MKTLTPRRTCALCDQKIKYKERLCPACQETWRDSLTSDWMRGIIEEANFQYNVLRRDIRNGVMSLEQLKSKL